MSISFMSMNRILEERAATDESVRRQLQRNGKRTLSDARRLSDEALVEKLRSLGLTHFDRDWLDDFSRKAPSAQVLATAVTRESGLEIPVAEEDWVWFGLVCLWERWFPERANFEMLDDAMQAGYRASERDETVERVRIWRDVWRGVRRLMNAFELPSIELFDDAFGGSNSVFNWVQDYSRELDRATRGDVSWATERLRVCVEMLSIAGRSERDSVLVHGFRNDMAECHAVLGNYDEVDRLYSQWLAEEPRWGGGWIGWSDLYSVFCAPGHEAPLRAEQILRDGLRIPDLEDREHLVERLAALYEELGRLDEAAALREESGLVPRSADDDSFHNETLDLERMIALDRITDDLDADGMDRIGPDSASDTIRNSSLRVGRNSPCPCGSGRKFKKCCGKARVSS